MLNYFLIWSPIKSASPFCSFLNPFFFFFINMTGTYNVPYRLIIILVFSLYTFYFTPIQNTLKLFTNYLFVSVTNQIRVMLKLYPPKLLFHPSSYKKSSLTLFNELFPSEWDKSTNPSFTLFIPSPSSYKHFHSHFLTKLFTSECDKSYKC